MAILVGKKKKKKYKFKKLKNKIKFQNIEKNNLIEKRLLLMSNSLKVIIIIPKLNKKTIIILNWFENFLIQSLGSLSNVFENFK